MKDSTKAHIRSVLAILANEIDGGHDVDGTINVPACLAAINRVAGELYTEQKTDANEIGTVVANLISRFPSLGKVSVSAMAARELTANDDNPLAFPATLKRVTAFVDEAYEARRGRVSKDGSKPTLVRKG